ncbi:MAG: acetylglutamate kinase [Lachnospiraceae bacterium]|nr:acetylglutamate kinase [Lachnospiraceae bacterium]
MNDEEMKMIQDKASVLVEALPYIREFNRKVIVVKYGGSAMSDKNLEESVIKDVTLLKLVGFKPVIVHGGGKEISRWIEKLGMKPCFVNGLRVTDKDTMEIVEMVLNKVNKDLVTLVEEQGIKGCGISGKDGGVFTVRKKLSEGKDIGFVGEITEVDTTLIENLLDDDFLPIISPIGMDQDYRTYNINADDAACAVAKAMKAEKLAFLSDIKGIYKDINDPDSFISRMSVREANELMDSGFVGGGMLPKLNSCIDAVMGGVNNVTILDGRMIHCLLLEIFTDHGIGSAIYK